MRRKPLSRPVLVLAALATSLVACSSAPAPQTLAGDATGVGPTGTAGTTGTTGTTGGTPTGPGTTGADGTTGTSGTSGTSGTTRTSSTTGTTGTAGTSGTSGSTTGSGRSGTTGPATRSTLFAPDQDRIGITDTSITMCAHAALTYGAAFNTEAADFNVFWTALNEEQGGVYGRKVAVTYENDNYTASDALVAARACQAKGIFMLIGGIGFDQIPAVRNYVEEQKLLYLHHTATIKGTEGQKYSFTALPTVERMGEGFAQLAIEKFRGKKIGIIKRDGPNWEPGVVAFKALAKQAGLQIVAERAVAASKANYTDEILAMRNAGAEVVWGWENALTSTQILLQAKRQNYSPNWMLFPFNLTSQNLGQDALSPPLDGVAMYTAYSFGDRGGSFSSYADDLALFEKQYAKYRPNADLQGLGGDLLFLNWQGQKALYDIFLACGKDCTRNRFVDTLTTYKKRPTSSACVIDFTRGDRQHGSDQVVFMQTYASPSGKVNWRNTKACVGPA
ncbi:MAG: ABC transporter substrate-binding protein [Mycobacteriales bacterium]|nr:ABC transporter substrate-binding protein [Mycobacteriales bacterium]